MEYAVKMVEITKEFPGVVANQGVNFSVAHGEIHGLVGENGAGKTTLMNILYGLYHQDSGEIYINGKQAHIKTPHEAIKLGIGMVHQHFMLVPSLTVLENIVLGKTPTRFGLNNLSKARRDVEVLLEKYSLKIDLNSKAYQLSVGQMQRVEIIKALYRGAHLLILDEPTAVLTPQETDDLFIILRELVKQDCSIIFITHKLKEVMAITDRVTVMRRGLVTGEVDKKDTNERELANLMVGRDVVLQVEKPPAHVHEEVLQVTDLNAFNERGIKALKGVSLTVRRGEIVGIAGVEGNGQSELVEVLAGLRVSSSGKIMLKGEDITHLWIRQRREMGMAHIPENRLLLGVSKPCTIEENLIMNKYDSRVLSRWIDLVPSKVEKFSTELIERFNIKTPSGKLPVSSLSGGNIQKVILARELESKPDLLIAAQLTRGVDVGAIEYIHKLIISMRDENTAVLLVSAELDEILSLSDRILVMYEGEVVGSFLNQNISETELGLYMAGVKRMQADALAV